MTSNALRPHVTIATIAQESVDAAVASLQRIPKGTDAAEIRLDFLWPSVPDGEAATDALLALVDSTPIPLIATLRPKRQGGRFEGAENVRVGLLQAALHAGFQVADAELDVLGIGDIATSLRQHGELIASQHSFGEMPCRSDGLRFLQSMQDFGVQFDKFAVPVGAFNETLRVLEFARAHAERGGRPALAPMGNDSVALRALLPLAGNRATYGAVPGIGPGVSGQPGLAAIQAIWQRWGLAPPDLDHVSEKPRPWLAIFGIPLNHSLSPAIHNAALKTANRDERFAALEVPASSSALRLMFHVAPRIGIVGASVTAPHKQDAARIAQSDSATAAIGAANCLRFTGDRIDATNTDATALARLLNPRVHAGDSALVLGAGGAGRAAIYVLNNLGAKVTVANRTLANAAKAEPLGATAISWEERNARRYKIIVNATPIGTDATDASPVSEANLAGKPHVVEMVYAGGPTQFQQGAAKAGCQIIDGRTLLLEQGIDAFRFWFGVEPNRDAMVAALGAHP